MLSCGRCCLRGKARAAIDFFPAAQNEPLLFLYPRLFSTHTPRRGRNGGGGAKGFGRQHTVPKHTPNPTFHPPSKPRSPVVPPQNPVEIDEESPFPFYGDGYINHLKHHFESLGSADAKENKWKDVPVDERPAAAEREKQKSWVDNLDDERTDRLMDMNKVYPWAFADSRHNLPLTYEEGERLSYMKRAEDRYSSSLEMTHAELRRCLDIIDSILDFREMARQRSTAPTSAEERVIYVPEGAIVELFGHEFENRAGFKLGSGCQVLVVNKTQSDAAGRRKLVLTGSTRSMEMAEEQLKRAAQRDHTSAFAPGRYAGTIPRPVWSSTRDVNDPNRIRMVQRRPSEVPRPTHWDVKTLANYVDDLVQCQLPESKLRQHYAHEFAFHTEVGNIILELLRDPSIHKHVTSKVAKTAITFFVHNQRLTDVNSLLPIFDELLTTRAFNEMLRAAGRRSDLYLFKTYIHAMKDAGLSPNGWEWVHFLKAIRSPKLRSYMLVHLQQIGVLEEHHILKAAVSCALQDSFCYHVSTGQDVFVYLDGLQQTFGDWISTPAINNLVLEASWMKSPEAIGVILEYCRQKDMPLDDRTLCYGLLYFVDTKRFKAGIQFFLEMIHTHRVNRTAVATQLLFVLAWKRRAYNVCRLIWRYCSLEGSVSWEMQDMILSSVSKNTPEYPTSIGQRWHKAIGKVVVGVTNDLVVSPFDPREPEDLPEPAYVGEPGFPSDLLVFTERDAGRHEQFSRCKELVMRDLRSFEKYDPYLAFEDMIMPAMRLDLEWGAVRQDDATWAVQNAIRVPVVSKTMASTKPILNHTQDYGTGFNPYGKRVQDDEGAPGPKGTASSSADQEHKQEHSAPVSTSRFLDLSRGPISDLQRPNVEVRYLRQSADTPLIDYPSRASGLSQRKQAFPC